VKKIKFGKAAEFEGAELLLATLIIKIVFDFLNSYDIQNVVSCKIC